MELSYLEKQNLLKAKFSNCKSKEEIYQKIISLGQTLPHLDEKNKAEKNLVPGCQSIVYLHSFLKGKRIFFQSESNALISAGLAYLLISVYSGEKAETILKCPPDYLEELEITTSITPARSNGLANIYLKMKQDTIKLIT